MGKFDGLLRGFNSSFFPAFERGRARNAQNQKEAAAHQLAQDRLALQQDQFGLQERKLESDLEQVAGRRADIDEDRDLAALDRDNETNRKLNEALKLQQAVEQASEAGNLTPDQRARVNAGVSGEEQRALLDSFVEGNTQTPSERDLLELQKITSEIEATDALAAQRRRPDGGPALPTDIRTLQALGIEPTLQGVKDLARARSTQVNVGNSPKPPTGFTFMDANDPSKGVNPIPGGPADPAFAKNLTGEQRKSAAASSRLGKISSRLNELEADGFNPAAAGELARAGIPFIGDFVKSEEFKEYETESRAWAETYLRETSGAVVTEEEQENTVRIFFPVAGDTPAVIAQKRQLRVEAEKAIAGKAGAAIPNEAGAGSAVRTTSGGNKYRVVQP